MTDQKYFVEFRVFHLKKRDKMDKIYTQRSYSFKELNIKKSICLGIGGRWRTDQLARTVNRQFYYQILPTAFLTSSTSVMLKNSEVFIKYDKSQLFNRGCTKQPTALQLQLKA